MHQTASVAAQQLHLVYAMGNLPCVPRTSSRRPACHAMLASSSTPPRRLISPPVHPGPSSRPHHPRRGHRSGFSKGKETEEVELYPINTTAFPFLRLPSSFSGHLHLIVTRHRVCHHRPAVRAMSLNSPSAHAPSKAVNSSSSQNQPFSQTHSHSSIPIDNQGQRRSGGAASFGLGPASRSVQASARHNQSSKKHHRNQRKPRLADEDAMAESVRRP